MYIIIIIKQDGNNNRKQKIAIVSKFGTVAMFVVQLKKIGTVGTKVDRLDLTVKSLLF